MIDENTRCMSEEEMWVGSSGWRLLAGLAHRTYVCWCAYIDDEKSPCLVLFCLDDVDC